MPDDRLILVENSPGMPGLSPQFSIGESPASPLPLSLPGLPSMYDGPDEINLLVGDACR